MVVLKDFVNLNLAEIYLVLAWRNDERISKFMLNKSVHLSEHLSFLSCLKRIKLKNTF